MVDKDDLIKALYGWYWNLEENNATDDEEFNRMLEKYNLTLEEIGVRV